MALVQVSYRERAGWTEQEGDSIRSFFKSKSHLVRDEESKSHQARDEESKSHQVRDEESKSHLVRDEESTQ